VAMAHRRPVLITATPTVASSLGELVIGVQVKPDDLAGLRSGINEMLTLVSTGRRWQFDEYLASHSWERNAAISVWYYRAAVGAGVSSSVCPLSLG